MQKESLPFLFQGKPTPSTPEVLNHQTVKEVIYWARYEGAQIRIDGAVAYRGADFPTNTSSADSSLAEIWKAWGNSFVEYLLQVLSRSGTVISILIYKSGNWSPVKMIPLV